MVFPLHSGAATGGVVPEGDTGWQSHEGGHSASPAATPKQTHASTLPQFLLPRQGHVREGKGDVSDRTHGPLHIPAGRSLALFNRGRPNRLSMPGGPGPHLGSLEFTVPAALVIPPRGALGWPVGPEAERPSPKSLRQ